MRISPRVSMPRTSAIVTLAGCLVFLISGCVFLLWSQNLSQQRQFQYHVLSAHNVGEVMFNKVQFPPVLLCTEIQQSTKDDREPLDQSIDDLREYIITEMTLRYQTDTTESVVEIRRIDSEEVQV